VPPRASMNPENWSKWRPRKLPSSSMAARAPSRPRQPLENSEVTSRVLGRRRGRSRPNGCCPRGQGGTKQDIGPDKGIPGDPGPQRYGSSKPLTIAELPQGRPKEELMHIRKVVTLMVVLLLAAAAVQAATGIFRFTGSSVHPTGSSSDRFGLGVVLMRTDVPVGESRKMALSAALRYMVASAQPDEPDADALDVDPIVLTASAIGSEGVPRRPRETDTVQRTPGAGTSVAGFPGLGPVGKRGPRHETPKKEVGNEEEHHAHRCGGSCLSFARGGRFGLSAGKRLAAASQRLLDGRR